MIDEIVPEPLGGAHRDVEGTAKNVSAILVRHLKALQEIPIGELLEKRYEKYRRMGQISEGS